MEPMYDLTINGINMNFESEILFCDDGFCRASLPDDMCIQGLDFINNVYECRTRDWFRLWSHEDKLELISEISSRHITSINIYNKNKGCEWLIQKMAAEIDLDPGICIAPKKLVMRLNEFSKKMRKKGLETISREFEPREWSEFLMIFSY